MSERVEPPAEHRGVRWHWLAWEDRVRPAEWVYEEWDIGAGLSAEQAARVGFRYLAPCIPPEVGDV